MYIKTAVLQTLARLFVRTHDDWDPDWRGDERERWREKLPDMNNIQWSRHCSRSPRPGIPEANLMALNERRGPRRPCDKLQFRDAFRWVVDSSSASSPSVAIVHRRDMAGTHAED